MSPWLIALHCALAMTAFTLALNGYLRGSAKRQIHVVLILLSIGLMLSGVFFGLAWFIAGITLYVVYHAISKPIARVVARNILGRRTSIDTGWTSGDVGHEFLDDWMSGRIQQRQEGKRKRLEQIAETVGESVLRRNGLSFEEFQELYRWLEIVPVDDDLRWDIVSDPVKLQQLITMVKDDRGRGSACRVYDYFSRM